MRWLRKWRYRRLRRRLNMARRNLQLLQVERSVLIAERDLLASVCARNALRVRAETVELAETIARAGQGSEA
jgi:vacuolar-type H+-ATPase subunit D/Vma8